MLDYEDLGSDQIACIDFLNDGEDALVCADVGTGKTVIALTAANEALDHGRINRWLVLAPLLVADDVWRGEHMEWSHLDHLTVGIAAGEDADVRKKIIDGGHEIVVLNYENLAWLMDEYPIKRKKVKGKTVREYTLPFDGLICDEVDKLKSVSSNRFKEFRKQIDCFKMRLGLTGTLLPTELTELWGQTFVVDGGQSLGRSFYKFRKEYFYPIDFKQRDWRPFKGTYEAMLEKLAGLVYRLKAKGLPEVTLEISARLALPPKVRAIYKELEDKLFLILEGGHKVDAANKGVLSGKLQQICAGFSYVEREDCHKCGHTIVLQETGKRRCAKCNTLAKPLAVWHSRDKFDWLDRELAEAKREGKQVLVFYHFREELDEILRRYPDMHYLSGVSRKKGRESVLLWNTGRLPYLALHPMSAGHGLNLQKSHAHEIRALTMPWSGGMFKQLAGRLARRGNPSKFVNVRTAVFEGTIDEDVIAKVRERLDTLDAFLDDIEAWQNAA